MRIYSPNCFCYESMIETVWAPRSGFPVSGRPFHPSVFSSSKQCRGWTTWIGAFVVVAHKVAVQTRRTAPRRRVRHEKVGGFCIRNIPKRFAHAHNQQTLERREIRVRPRAQFFNIVVAFDRNPRNRAEFFPQPLPQLVTERFRLIVHLFGKQSRPPPFSFAYPYILYSSIYSDIKLKRTIYPLI